jgi:L-threonylcarbamoyladenylate synthase
MQIIKLINNNHQQVINQAIAVLKNGGLVIYPTETVYGAGVDATNQSAVTKLLNYKSRREGKPLSIAVASQTMAKKYVVVNEQAQKLYDKFLPGPYTIISESEQTLAQGVASEFNTVGIRIPQQQLILDLTKQYNRPITATSANASDKKRPYSVDDILKNLSTKQKNLIDLIIDAGTLPRNEPSTVIDTTLSTPLTVRGKSAVNKSSQNKSLTLISHNEQETRAIAGKILLKYWKQIKQGGLIIGLSGELGAGKTIFAKGIADFLQIEDIITSPTYTYLKEYPYNRHQVKGYFYHLDLWRLNRAEDVNSLQIDKLPGKKIVIAIEWWTQVKKLLPQVKPDIEVELKVLAEEKRQLKIYER